MFDCGLHSYCNFYFEAKLYIIENGKSSCSVFADIIVYNDTWWYYIERLYDQFLLLLFVHCRS